MKHIGIIGSMEHDLPQSYCRIINEEVRLRRGGRHTASFTLHALNAYELDSLLRLEDWATLVESLGKVARVMAGAGVEGLAICGSALNPIAREIGRAARLPVISMGRALTATLEMFRYRRVVIAGTKTSREAEMWRDELQDIEILELSEPEEEWLETLAENRNGENIEDLRAETNRIITQVRRRGVQAAILADPALRDWINLEESLLPVFDAAEIHAWAVAGWALKGEGQMLSAPPCVIRDE